MAFRQGWGRRMGSWATTTPAELRLESPVERKRENDSRLERGSRSCLCAYEDDLLPCGMHSLRPSREPDRNPPRSRHPEMPLPSRHICSPLRKREWGQWAVWQASLSPVLPPLDCVVSSSGLRTRGTREQSALLAAVCGEARLSLVSARMRHLRLSDGGRKVWLARDRHSAQGPASCGRSCATREDGSASLRCGNFLSFTASQGQQS